ncbi:MAG: 16S rRNA (guanine(966)-N(2))-methyltransferase RsmD [Deltaproteobacteria bacterium]|nr:16S rRNA (guanine(966)-N(2))-methyltransferase RsmD [Deltaproteobacteria bacterium]
MRVIAGICRGMKLLAPTGTSTRPTSDKVKEALFNIISSRISFDDVRVLDICAGTGSLGIEALSRGAAACIFIENERRVLACLEKNISDARITDRSEISSMDALKALSVIVRRGLMFDLVLFDPPYDSGLYASVPEALCKLGLLASNALFVAECSARNPLPDSIGPLARFDRRVYGDSALELFILEET